MFRRGFGLSDPVARRDRAYSTRTDRRAPAFLIIILEASVTSLHCRLPFHPCDLSGLRARPSISSWTTRTIRVLNLWPRAIFPWSKTLSEF